LIGGILTGNGCKRVKAGRSGLVVERNMGSLGVLFVVLRQGNL
jgi:hypothetical protein